MIYFIKKISLVLCLGLFLFSSSYGQDDKGGRVPLSVSYYGNTFIHEGIKLSADWMWLEIQKSKGKKDKEIRRQLYTSPYLSYYSHTGSHKGVQIGADALWRRCKPKGWFREAGVGIGYFRRFNSGETWEVADNGEVSKVGGSSRGYFTYGFSVATGKEFTLENEMTLAPFIRLNTNILLGYNTSSLLHANFEIGCRVTSLFTPKRGNAKIITKERKRKEKKS